MKVWAVIAARPPEEGKSRLAGVLNDAERRELNETLFKHVLAVVAINFPLSTMVISRSERLLDLASNAGAVPLRESGSGLNEAFRQATNAVLGRGGHAMLALPSDLPELSSADLEAVLAAGEEGSRVVIATDRHCYGTNALLIKPPGAIPFLFGDDSRAAHLQAARAARLRVSTISSLGLSRDIDTPADLRFCQNGRGIGARPLVGSIAGRTGAMEAI
jgi:2-phospho-L-lactate/phosphoenolpyruvate guanylyltransferase